MTELNFSKSLPEGQANLQEELSPFMKKLLEAVAVCQELIESGEMTQYEILDLIKTTRKENKKALEKP